MTPTKTFAIFPLTTCANGKVASPPLDRLPSFFHYNNIDCGWGVYLGIRASDRFMVSAGAKIQFNSFDQSYDNYNITYGLSVAYMF